jgi:hypothetical protein
MQGLTYGTVRYGRQQTGHEGRGLKTGRTRNKEQGMGLENGKREQGMVK